MKIQILASGSSGNATILRDGDTTVLLDAGISMRRIRVGLEEMGLRFEDLDAIVVTHDHSDHIKGLKMIRKYHGYVPIHASRGTASTIGLSRHARGVEAGKVLEIGDLEFHPYEVSHDAREPLGFRVESRSGTRLGWATDLGEWNDETVAHLEGCRMVMLEANHDTKMLARGPYPPFLKRRVGSREGHLSNAQAMRLLERIAGPELEVVALGHLSESNNSSDVAMKTIGAVLEGARVHLRVANRKTPTELIEFPGEYEPWEPEPPLQGLLF